MIRMPKKKKKIKSNKIKKKFNTNIFHMFFLIILQTNQRINVLIQKKLTMFIYHVMLDL